MVDLISHSFVVNWFILVGVFFMALLSPGPDFVMAVRQSVMHGRRAGIVTAIGFALGVAVHVTYCLLGIAALISQSIVVFSVLKYLGAAYLLYVGIGALRSRGLRWMIRKKRGHVPVCLMAKLCAQDLLPMCLIPKQPCFFWPCLRRFLVPICLR